jgi:hypothetical protein
MLLKWRILLGHSDARTTMIYTHVLNRGCKGVKSPADVFSYATAAVLGPLGEAVTFHYGAWTYAKSSLLIPIWLPLLWSVAGLFLRRFTWTVTSIQPNRE